MIPLNKKKAYKTAVSLIFGALGFYCNFHTIIFPFGNYTVAVLFGLLFPLLIALSWGWHYGLLSALAGGCQTMWWLWGPSNGYAIFLVAPPFTLWVVWHGIFAGLRARFKNHKWWLNMYILEIPFRLLNTINLLVLSRWAITLNPPPWKWAASAINTIPMNFSVFVAIKQACVAFILLLAADVLLNINLVRTFFRLKPVVDQKRTGYVVSIFLLIGCLFWLLDSIFHAFAFNEDLTFIDLFALNIPHANLFTRITFIICCMGAGMVTARILRRQKEGETEVKTARKDAVTRETFFRTLVRTIPDLVWLKDPQGIYLSCNSEFESLVGAPEADIVGKTDYDLVGREQADTFRTQDKMVMAGKEARVIQEEVTFAGDRHRKLLETIKTPMFNTDGQLIGVLGIGRDITERATLQAQLAQAQKMESVGRLAGGVAHDFNNMLSIILGNSEIILYDLPEDSPFIENLREIQSATQRSSNLTRQLLAFARKQTISPQVVNLNDAIEGILKMIRRLIGEDIHLAWQPGPDLWPVKVDPSQVDQILANLCVNARDAIADIGKMIIETGNVTLDDGYCRDHDGFRPGDFVKITVSDTGCGMSEEIREHIFEPFYTTKDSTKGTGLGLATVYGVMKQNDGFINVYSEPGKGSVFRLYLPRHTAKGSEKTGPTPIERNFKGRETILLVEDEPGILKITQKRLEQLGYTILAFTSPIQAFERAHESGPIHLLMTDVVMPEMNGRDLSRKIEAVHPGIKCLFMSGYTADVIAHHGILDEGLNFISKPFSIRELSIKLREILELGH